MAAGKRVQSATGSQSHRSAGKTALVGVDPAVTLTSESGRDVELSWWDVWFALVAQADFDADWEGLRRRFRQDRDRFSLRETAERKLSHLRDLQQRLAVAGVQIDAILERSPSSQSELRRARNRVLQKSQFPERELSDAMRFTPKQRGLAQALRGSWPLFPVSPAEYADRLAARLHTRRWFSAEQSFGIERKLDAFLDDADGEVPAEAQAMLRAFLTVVVELMEVADDSYGCIADTFRRGFAAYLELPCDETGIEEQVFFRDLLSFLIWENYGLTYEQADGYFESIASAEGDLCIDYLQRQVEELQVDDLDYQSEQARTLLGQVVAEQDRFELFEHLAREMGSRGWRRVVVLADRAVRKHKRKLAAAVLEAALRDGADELLERKLAQLKRGKWNPDPRK